MTDKHGREIETLHDGTEVVRGQATSSGRCMTCGWGVSAGTYLKPDTYEVAHRSLDPTMPGIEKEGYRWRSSCAC